MPKVVEDIDKRFARVIVTKWGQPVVMMLSVDDYESMVETMNVLSDKSGLERIKKGVRQAKSGKTVSLDDFRRRISNTQHLVACWS